MTHIIRVSLLSVSLLQNHEAAQRLSATPWGCQRAPSDPNPPCSGRICPPHPASSRCLRPPVQSPAMDLARGERGRKKGFHPVRSSPWRPEHHAESRKERLGRAGPSSETPLGPDGEEPVPRTVCRTPLLMELALVHWPWKYT